MEFEDLVMPASIKLTRYCTLSHRKYEKGSHRAVEGHSPLFKVNKTLSSRDVKVDEWLGREGSLFGESYAIKGVFG
jgi:hypothetical protein